jgi:hypothetical protein
MPPLSCEALMRLRFPHDVKFEDTVFLKGEVYEFAIDSAIRWLKRGAEQVIDEISEKGEDLKIKSKRTRRETIPENL